MAFDGERLTEILNNVQNNQENILKYGKKISNNQKILCNEVLVFEGYLCNFMNVVTNALPKQRKNEISKTVNEMVKYVYYLDKNRRR